MSWLWLIALLLVVTGCAGSSGTTYQEPGAADYCRTHAGIGNCQ
jgi:hypothetical protein